MRHWLGASAIAQVAIPQVKKGRTLKGSGPSRLAAQASYDEAIVIAGVEKPTKVSVYVKLSSVALPPARDLRQFPLGQVACAKKSAAVGVPVDIWGTVILPFFARRVPVLVGPLVVCDFTSTRLPPLFVQSTVAEYVALRLAFPFVLPMPLIW